MCVGVAEALGNTPIYEALRQRSMASVKKAQQQREEKKAAKEAASAAKNSGDSGA